MSIKGKHPLVVKTKRCLMIALLAAALIAGTNLVNGQEGEMALNADAKLVNGQECEDAQALARQQRAGQRVFEKETFGGNGRVCSTCHMGAAGTFSPEQARELFARDPKHPLFRPIDSDDGVGTSYNRLLTHGTVRIAIPLPANVEIVGEPGNRTAVLFRGTPSTNNVAFENALMLDGRLLDLQSQAVDAVISHYQPRSLPTVQQQADVRAFQQTLFSNERLRNYFKTGIPPQLPKGNTASEKRGARWFDGSTPDGKCAQCHSGPLLNTTNAFNGCSTGRSCAPFPQGQQLQPAGQRFSANLASEFNQGSNPIKTYLFRNIPGFGDVTMVTADPGRALVNGGNPCLEAPLACVLQGPGRAVPIFKIPSLWGIKDTAPYFHDNSAATLEAVLRQYQIFFHLTAVGLNDPSFEISDQDAADIIAFLKLL
jgi:cytochrome c peroxidase